jgi:hypothetical protein
VADGSVGGRETDVDVDVQGDKEVGRSSQAVADAARAEVLVQREKRRKMLIKYEKACTFCKMGKSKKKCEGKKISCEKHPDHIPPAQLKTASALFGAHKK